MSLRSSTSSRTPSSGIQQNCFFLKTLSLTKLFSLIELSSLVPGADPVYIGQANKLLSPSSLLVNHCDFEQVVHEATITIQTFFLATFTFVYLHRSVKARRRTGVTTQGLTTLTQWTYIVKGACMCHIFLVLHFQIGQPIMGTKLDFYFIIFL